jgi:hypothetical protein
MESVQIAPNQIDRFTGYQVNISSDHAYIHQGIGFTISSESPSVAAAATYAIALQIPDGVFVHLRPTKWSSTANIGELKMFEGSTFTGGSAITPVNHNRNSKNTTKVVATGGVTATNTNAILLFNETAGTGGGPASLSGGSGGQDEEWVLRPNRTYVFQFENIGATTATVFYYNFFWYEEVMG